MRMSTRARILALGTVVVLGLTGSSAANAAGPAAAGHAAQQAAAPRQLPAKTTPPTPLPSIGQPSPVKTTGMQATVNSLHRDSSGLVTLTWTFKYSGSDDFYPNEHFDYPLTTKDTTAGNVSLTDESAKLRYNPLRMEPSLSCTCTTLVAVPSPVDNTMSVTFYETYKLPADVSTVTVQIAEFSPLKNVKIS